MDKRKERRERDKAGRYTEGAMVNPQPVVFKLEPEDKEWLDSMKEELGGISSYMRRLVKLDREARERGLDIEQLLTEGKKITSAIV